MGAAAPQLGLLGAAKHLQAIVNRLSPPCMLPSPLLAYAQKRPAVQLRASTTDTMRGATTPIIITAQLVGLTDSLGGKAVTLFLSDPSPLTCSSNSATTSATGAATFSCSATGVGTASVSASFREGTTSFGEVQPLSINVLAPTVVSALLPQRPASAPALATPWPLNDGDTGALPLMLPACLRAE